MCVIQFPCAVSTQPRVVFSVKPVLAGREQPGEHSTHHPVVKHADGWRRLFWFHREFWEHFSLTPKHTLIQDVN